MRYSIVTALSLSLLIGFGKANAADGLAIEADAHATNAHVDISLFKDSLSSDGKWIEDATYGTVWQPAVVVENKDWMPYHQDGHWVFTNDGWFWESDYSWGWAAFHYGRWFHSPQQNWVWVPGTEWAPSWVSWRHSDNVYGWAPLPPEATYQAGVGLSFRGRIGAEADIRDDYYTFVPSDRFLSTNIATVALPRAEVRAAFNQTQIVNNTYVFNDNRVVNNGISVREVSQRTKQEVKPVQVTDAQKPGKAARNQNGISVYRPAKTAAKNQNPNEPVKTGAAADPKPNEQPQNTSVNHNAQNQTPAQKTEEQRKIEQAKANEQKANEPAKTGAAAAPKPNEQPQNTSVNTNNAQNQTPAQRADEQRNAEQNRNEQNRENKTNERSERNDRQDLKDQNANGRAPAVKPNEHPQNTAIKPNQAEETQNRAQKSPEQREVEQKQKEADHTAIETAQRQRRDAEHVAPPANTPPAPEHKAAPADPSKEVKPQSSITPAETPRRAEPAAAENRAQPQEHPIETRTQQRVDTRVR